MGSAGPWQEWRNKVIAPYGPSLKIRMTLVGRLFVTTASASPWRPHRTLPQNKSTTGSNLGSPALLKRVIEQSAMRTFAFWYAVFLVGSAVGATAGSSFGNGFAVVAGLLGGMVISGGIAERLQMNRSSAICPEKPLVRPKQTATAAQGLERIRFASASPGLETSETKAVEHDTLGAAFYLPKGMSEFAMRKQSEKQTSFQVSA
jgi:hypothetical protein